MKEEDELADLALIERFLEGKVSRKEHTAIEKRLKEDTEFALLLEDVKLLVSGIRKNSRDRLLSSLKKIDVSGLEAKGNRRTVSPKQHSWPLAVAATLIIGIGITWWNLGSMSPEDLFLGHFTPYPNLLLPQARGGGEDFSLKAKAYALYDKGEYTEAILAFESLNESHDDGVLMYLGNCYLATGRTEEAVVTFEKLEKNSTAWRSTVWWYLGLAHLANKDAEEARQWFEKLAASENAYRRRAKQILQKL